MGQYIFIVSFSLQFVSQKFTFLFYCNVLFFQVDGEQTILLQYWSVRYISFEHIFILKQTSPLSSRHIFHFLLFLNLHVRETEPPNLIFLLCCAEFIELG